MCAPSWRGRRSAWLLLEKLRKKGKDCHSERRFCAKNLSYYCVLRQERFFASLRMTIDGLFPQPAKPGTKRGHFGCSQKRGSFGPLRPQ